MDGEALELARELVRRDSSNPGAYEGGLEAWIKARLAQRGDGVCGFELSELEALPGRRCLMASLAGSDPALPRLVYSCHMDTVGLGDGWDLEGGIAPLGALVRDGRLYGRGSCDMKGGLACALSALGEALDRARDGEKPRRTFALLLSVDEEDQMRGIEAAIGAGWVGANDWVLDCEPTDGQIQVAHKGRTWFELRFDGVTAHASQPWHGADAVAALAEAVCAVRRGVEALPAHPELGHTTATFGRIEGGYSPYVVPDQARVWIDMRPVPPFSTEAARELVERAIAGAEAAVPGCRGSYIVTGDRPPIERDPASPLLAALLAATRRVCGTPAEVGIFTGYTDTAVIAARTGNKNCMSYGPGSLAQAHKPNEFVPLADLDRVEAVLRDLADKLVWRDKR